MVANWFSVQPFRLDDGTPVQHRSLRLQLRDLAPTACITDLSEEDQDSTVVAIPYEKQFIHPGCVSSLRDLLPHILYMNRIDHLGRSNRVRSRVFLLFMTCHFTFAMATTDTDGQPAPLERNQVQGCSILRHGGVTSIQNLWI